MTQSESKRILMHVSKSDFCDYYENSVDLLKTINMSREEIIEKTIRVLNMLPEDKGAEVADFADFILHKIEENDLQKGIEHISASSGSFDFLNDEEELYTVEDIKEKY